MKPALQLKLSQHLALTPQLQQSIKLLQLSTLEMNQEIERYLLENPLLERDGEDGGENYGGGSFDGGNAGEQRNESSEREREAPEERGESEPERMEMPTGGEDDDRWSSDAGTFSGA